MLVKHCFPQILFKSTNLVLKLILWTLYVHFISCFCCVLYFETRYYSSRLLIWHEVYHSSWNMSRLQRSARSLKIECKSLNSTLDSVKVNEFWEAYRECRRNFRFISVLGTPAFGLKEIFKIIHHSSLKWRMIIAVNFPI